MIAETFRKPANGEDGRWWSVSEISKALASRYHAADMRQATLQRIGMALTLPRFGFDSRRRAQGTVYWLAER
jgi:hypothetical protein